MLQHSPIKKVIQMSNTIKSNQKYEKNHHWDK